MFLMLSKTKSIAEKLSQAANTPHQAISIAAEKFVKKSAPQLTWIPSKIAPLQCGPYKEKLPFIFGHRGASKAEKENTLKAFKRTSQMKISGVELDVRMTADDVCVIHHDAFIKNEDDENEKKGESCGDSNEKKLYIRELLYKDLPEHIPTLHEALDACEGWVNVEIKNSPKDPHFFKNDEIAEVVAKELMKRNEHNRFIVSSFRLSTVTKFREIAPSEIRTAYLWQKGEKSKAYTFEETEIDNLVEQVHNAGIDALHPRQNCINRELIGACHEKGLQVSAWVVDDVETAVKFIHWGVDGICTNKPDVLRAIDVAHADVQQISPIGA